MLDLAAEAAKAVATLEQLTKASSSEKGKEGSHTLVSTLELNGNEISAASGVAFCFSRKAGLGLSVSYGTGFVLAKVNDKPGWSAPLPFSVTTSGLGFTIGYSEVDTLVILDSPEAVCEFLKTQVSLDSHLNLSAGRYSADASETALDVRHPGNSWKRFSYSVSHGLMLDASWNGAGISVKDEDLHQLYGPDVTREDVLSCKVEPPQAFGPLYAALNRLSFFADNAAAP